ncbi:hypothetical protein GP486_002162 [Trichoglossum hirsutum]|uniref:ubiquitinyl hydrolase 1 n=1 Tax=Trichoglossum hirsutum TaxID=265104 RepID=A0A9P8LES3_9PEZI|nr:hypothetical protein GP486_002162 [Trichoglossum hirsutum]
MVYEPEDRDAVQHVSPMHFTQAYAAIYGGDYDGEASQDAHETLNQTLNRLKDEERALGNTSTMVESVFQGIVFNHFTCKRCGHKSNMTDDFMELGVTMPGLPSGSAKSRGGHVTLAQCFDTFREQEEFPDRKCRDCSAIGGVSKVSSLGHVPSHLAVQIRRWQQVVGRRGRVTFQKIDTKVNFPVQEVFDLSPWVSDAAAASAGDLNYELYGVVEHHGSGLNDGHYIAYVKRDDGWWEMDDESTTRVKPGSVGRANPYLLFYRKG